MGSAQKWITTVAASLTQLDVDRDRWIVIMTKIGQIIYLHHSHMLNVTIVNSLTLKRLTSANNRLKTSFARALSCGKRSLALPLMQIEERSLEEESQKPQRKPQEKPKGKPEMEEIEEKLVTEPRN